MPIYLLSPSTILVVDVIIKLNNMIDKKIEEAKEEIYEDRFLLNGEEVVFDNDTKEEMFYKEDIKEAIGLGAKWAINEFIKDPVNAIDALIEADREFSKSDWVSVEDGLPPYDESVFVTSKDAPDIVIRTSRAKGKGWNIDKNGFLCSPVSHITHWKPIEKLEG